MDIELFFEEISKILESQFVQYIVYNTFQCPIQNISVARKFNITPSTMESIYLSDQNVLEHFRISILKKLQMKYKFITNVVFDLQKDFNAYITYILNDEYRTFKETSIVNISCAVVKEMERSVNLSTNIKSVFNIHFFRVPFLKNIIPQASIEMLNRAFAAHLPSYKILELNKTNIKFILIKKTINKHK